MNCAEFDRWLDDGGTADAGSAHAALALAHAQGCAPCARALESARAIEALLAAAPVAAPPRLTAQVMARIATAPQLAGTPHVAAPAPERTLAWWVVAAADPATVLAAVVAAMLMWKGEVLLRGALAFVNASSAAISNAPGAAAAALVFASDRARVLFPLDRPEVPLALALATLPAVLWASWRMYAWFDRRMTPVPRGPVRG